MDKEKWLEIVWKTRKKKGRRLTKKELREVWDGAIALEKLGVFNKPNWSPESRRERKYGKK